MVKGLFAVNSRLQKHRQGKTFSRQQIVARRYVIDLVGAPNEFGLLRRNEDWRLV